MWGHSLRQAYSIHAGFRVVLSLYPSSCPSIRHTEITTRLHGELERILKLPAVYDRVSSSGGELQATTPQQPAAIISTDIAKCARIVNEARVRVD